MSIVDQRKLVATLRQLRTDRRLTQTEVAKDMDWSLSKVIRVEGGTVAVSVSDLRSLLAYYGVQDVEPLLALARSAKARGPKWWKSFQGRVPDEMLHLAAYEAEATSVWSFEPLVVPGVLQTESYAEAVSFDPVDVEFRLRRRAELVLNRAPEMVFIVDESVLYRTPDTERSTLADQLESILDDTRLPNVRVLVLPFNAGAHQGWSGSFTVLDCAGQRLLVTANGFQGSEDTAEIDAAEDVFKDLFRRSHSAERSVEMIRDVIDGLRSA